MSNLMKQAFLSSRIFSSFCIHNGIPCDDMFNVMMSVCLEKRDWMIGVIKQMEEDGIYRPAFIRMIEYHLLKLRGDME